VFQGLLKLRIHFCTLLAVLFRRKWLNLAPSNWGPLDQRINSNNSAAVLSNLQQQE